MMETTPDELAEILRKIQYRPSIRADTSPRGRSEHSVEHSPELIEAARKARLILEGGSWTDKRKITPIAKLHRVDPDRVLDFILSAESDSGRYVAIPNDRTPEAAPDEG